MNPREQSERLSAPRVVQQAGTARDDWVSPLDACTKKKKVTRTSVRSIARLSLRESKREQWRSDGPAAISFEGGPPSGITAPSKRCRGSTPGAGSPPSCGPPAEADTAAPQAAFCSTPIRLQVRAGPGSAVVLDSGTVLPIKVHRKEETGEILNLSMAWAEKGLELKVDVPVVFKGEDVCPGLKKGGYLHKLRTSLKYLCPTEHILPKFEVDLTNLDIGDRVFMHDIRVHLSLKLLSENDTMPICKILAAQPIGPEPKPTSEATETQDSTGL